jgi:V8-like Glu-specific endopeptidase
VAAEVLGVPYPVYVDGDCVAPFMTRNMHLSRKFLFGRFAAHFCDAPDRRFRLSSSLNSICELQVAYEHGTGAATGFLISPSVVVTAAHVIRPDTRPGTPRVGEMESVIVRPGRTGDLPALPLEITAVRRDTEVCPSWDRERPNGDHDYAAIILGDEGRTKFSAIKPMQVRVLDDGDITRLEGQGVRWRLVGYPADWQFCDRDKSRGFQWSDEGKTSRRFRQNLQYNICSSEGQSGSPLFFIEDDQPVAIAIHSSALNDTKTARWIKDDLAAAIEKWMKR